jgi:hypothetical protein
MLILFFVGLNLDTPDGIFNENTKIIVKIITKIYFNLIN